MPIRDDAANVVPTRTRQAIRRGTFTHVADLQAAIGTYIDSYNQSAKPFACAKTADQLIGKIKRKSINNTFFRG